LCSIVPASPRLFLYPPPPLPFFRQGSFPLLPCFPSTDCQVCFFFHHPKFRTIAIRSPRFLPFLFPPRISSPNVLAFRGLFHFVPTAFPSACVIIRAGQLVSRWLDLFAGTAGTSQRHTTRSPCPATFRRSFQLFSRAPSGVLGPRFLLPIYFPLKEISTITPRTLSTKHSQNVRPLPTNALSSRLPGEPILRDLFSCPSIGTFSLTHIFRLLLFVRTHSLCLLPQAPATSRSCAKWQSFIAPLLLTTPAL